MALKRMYELTRKNYIPKDKSLEVFLMETKSEMVTSRIIHPSTEYYDLFKHMVTGTRVMCAVDSTIRYLELIN
jgi:hypothetical protein